MHKKIKRVLSCIMAAVVTLTSLHCVITALERKDSRIRYQDFLEQKQDFDVLFLGTSHMINGVYPMELWNDYGIVSYNLAGHSAPIATSYWILKNALNHTQPKVVVIDCLGIQNSSKVSNTFDYTHMSFDAFPISLTKIQAANDLLCDSDDHSIWELIFPFSKYHNRWSQMTNEDFYPEADYEKGGEMRIDLAEPLYYDKVSSDSIMENDTLSITYLEKIITECQDRGIEVLLTYLPFPAKEEYQREANRVYLIAEEYGIDYINFLDLDLVDYTTDCYDIDSHLNPSGARKVTDYIGQYITDNYDVSDKRNNPEYTFWASDYQEYQAKKTEELTDIEDAYVYMTMLTDHNYDIILEVTDNIILEDAKFCGLLANMGIDCTQMAQSKYVVLHNRENLVDYITEADLSNGSVNTCIGNFTKDMYTDNHYLLTVEGKEYADISIEDSSGIHMRSIIVDHESGELIESIYYMHIADENVDVDTILVRIE